MSSNPVTLVKVGGSLLDWPELPERLTAFLDERRVRLARDLARPDLRRRGFRRFRPPLRPHASTGRLRGPPPGAPGDGPRLDRAAVHPPGAMGVDRVEMLELKWAASDIPLLVTSTIVDELEEEEASPLPHSWDVTSDTIAAWIAGRVEAQSLVLLKSVSLPEGADPRGRRKSQARRSLLPPDLVGPPARGVPQPEGHRRRSRWTCPDPRRDASRSS